MKQRIDVATAPIQAQVVISGSKSITNRALLLAALSRGVSILSGVLFSDDTWAFIRGLQALGVHIVVDSQNLTCEVSGCNGRFPAKQAVIACDKAGTAARFLLAACAGMSGYYEFDADPQLRKRPLASLLAILVQQGMRCEQVSMPLQMQGNGALLGGEIVVPNEESSQFVSALMMMAPFATQDMIVTIPETMRRSYSDMTAAMMHDFGVRVLRPSPWVYTIPVPQYYQARSYVIEPDFSTASYFFAAAAVTQGQVTIPGMNRDRTYQGDSQFLTVLEKMGCRVLSDKLGLTVIGPAELSGVDVDMHSYSDVFMSLAAIAPFANSPTRIRRIGHTRLQESDRISAMCRGLSVLQITVEEESDGLTIYPGAPKAGVIDSYQDHRIAMAFSIIGLRVAGIEIEGAECVAKTCPLFFEQWAALV